MCHHLFSGRLCLHAQRVFQAGSALQGGLLEGEQVLPCAWSWLPSTLSCSQVLLRQHMYIMADCTAREGGRHDERVLVHIEALPDGSASMQPGISTSDEAYRLEDASGQALCTHEMA